MAKYRDKTQIGGAGEVFQTTCWTMINDAMTCDADRQMHVVNSLMSKYWKPVYCYLRQKGFSNDYAKDLTQSFFLDIVWGRNLIQQADKEEGKFRTFLLTALDRFVTDEYRKENAAKRKPQGNLMAIDDIDIADSSLDSLNTSPEEIFNYAWITELLDSVFAEVERECQQANMQVHWQIFKARVLNPVIENVKEVPIPELCEKYEIKSSAKASNMVVTVKRRLAKALERHLGSLTSSEDLALEEIEELKEYFSKLFGK